MGMRGGTFSPGTVEASRKAVLDICRHYAAPRVLDVGCGRGDLLLAIAPSIARGCGVDIAEAEIRIAGQRAADRDHLRFRVARAEDLAGLEAGPFDVILFIGSLEHMTDPARALEVAGTLVDPGGRIVVVAISPRAPHAVISRWMLKRSRNPVVAHLGADGLRALADRVGFQVEEVRPLYRGSRRTRSGRAFATALAAYDRLGGRTAAVILRPAAVEGRVRRSRAGAERRRRGARAAIADWLGLGRSLVLYWRPGRQRGLRRLYRTLLGPGDVVFDIGAHLGDRSVAFAALGARVVAVEPQPRIAAWLERLGRCNSRITVETVAVGRAPGTGRLAVSRRTPTVSTLADDWRRKVPGANPSLAKVRWDEEVEVTVTTLDSLAERYGLPRFCKIDVEGYEAEVLEGLSHAIPALSVEFVQGRLDIAAACIRRLEELGAYEFNAILGERRRFVFPGWQSGDRMLDWLEAGAANASSGDLYARLVASPPGIAAVGHADTDDPSPGLLSTA